MRTARWEEELISSGRVLRSVLFAGLVVLSLAGAGRPALAEGGVEQRIAEFWQRIDGKAPTDLLAAADLGQWGLNVIERDASARITVLDFRASTGAMQAAMERVRQVTAGTPSVPAVESRIADFWTRLDAMQSGDYLASADLGQWALNVTARDPNARITVTDFRASTASMQGAIEGRRPPTFGCPDTKSYSHCASGFAGRIRSRLLHRQGRRVQLRRLRQPGRRSGCPSR